MSKTFTIEVEVTEERVGDLLCSAFESSAGSVYWARVGEYVEPIKWTFTGGGAEGAYGWTYPLNVHGAVIIDDLEDDEKTYRLDLKAIKRGLEAFAKADGGVHFAAWLTEDDDAITGDAFLQCCLFGEVKYS